MTSLKTNNKTNIKRLVLTAVLIGVGVILSLIKIYQLPLGGFITLLSMLLMSGAIIFDIWLPEKWDNPWLYSLVYNGSYMLPELLFNVIGAVILFRIPQFSRLIESNLEK